MKQRIASLEATPSESPERATDNSPGQRPGEMSNANSGVIVPLQKVMMFFTL